MNKRNFLLGVTTGLVISIIISKIRQKCWSTKRFEKQYADLMRPVKPKEGDDVE